MRTFRIIDVDTHFLVKAEDIPTATAKVKAHPEYISSGVALTVSSFNITQHDKIHAVLELLERHGIKDEVRFTNFSDNMQIADLSDGKALHVRDVLEGAAAHVTLFDGRGATMETTTINKALFDHWCANASSYVIVEGV